MPWARPSIASPSAVKATEWVSRTKRRRDAACSRRRTCWLTVDCRSPRRRPASVKLRAFATVTKVVSRVGSNMARSSRNVMTITPVIGLHNVLPHRHLEQRHQAALRSRSMRTLSRFRPDEFSIAMLATVTLSLLLPCRGPSARVFELLTAIAIALLFFLQGARLSRAAIVAGHLLQPWIGIWVRQRRKVLGGVDRGSVLLVVYTVFSGATLSGIWHQLTLGPLLALFAVSGALLALMLAITALVARGLRFSREDEIAIMFCGSKKSLVTGIPMANVLFAGQAVGLIVLPLMVFHQIQLMACAALARHYASTSTPAFEPKGVGEQLV